MGGIKKEKSLIKKGRLPDRRIVELQMGFRAMTLKTENIGLGETLSIQLVGKKRNAARRWIYGEKKRKKRQAGSLGGKRARDENMEKGENWFMNKTANGKKKSTGDGATHL